MRINTTEAKGKEGVKGLIELTKQINQEEFKKDFNLNVLSNNELIKKYGFKSIKECCDYAQKNNLIIENKPTEEEKKSWEGISKFLKEVFGE